MRVSQQWAESGGEVTKDWLLDPADQYMDPLQTYMHLCVSYDQLSDGRNYRFVQGRKFGVFGQKRGWIGKEKMLRDQKTCLLYYKLNSTGTVWHTTEDMWLQPLQVLPKALGPEELPSSWHRLALVFRQHPAAGVEKSHHNY